MTDSAPHDVEEPANPVTGSTLAQLTAAKAVANTALRWIPLFLPTLERAFGVSTTQLTTVLGLGEGAGLSTVLVGKQLDRGRERTVMVAGLCAIAVSSLVALGGSIWTFALAFVLLILGVANFTVGGHAWISHRIDYRWRARSIGLFETSWAIALLVGAPLIAVVINVFGWRGPFVVLAVASALAAVGVSLVLPPSSTTVSRSEDDGDHVRHLTRRAWLTVAGSAILAPAGLSIFVISGTWLHDSFGVSTGGLGAIAMSFGGIELIASTGTAAFADRLGKMRSTLGGVIVLGIGLCFIVSANDRLLVGVIGLLLLLIGFEYSFVTSFSLVSEAMPQARGRTLAMSNAIGTVTRGVGTVASGALYASHGIAGPVVLAALAATTAATCLVLSRRAG